jgi:four helix bundle protein
MQDFRRLEVYRRSKALAVDVRKNTSAFPRTGYGSLKDQTIRAAEAIPFNIAEGCGARTQKEFARFLDIAIKSTCELEAELELIDEYGIMKATPTKPLAEETVEIRRMLCGLRSRVLKSPDK